MDDVIQFVKENVGNEVVITTDIDKKKRDSVKCIIKEVYNSIFVVEVIGETFDNIRTFTYSDIYSKQILVDKVN